MRSLGPATIMGPIFTIATLVCVGCASSTRSANAVGSVRSPLVRASDGSYSPGEKMIALPAVAEPYGQEPKPTVGIGPPPNLIRAVLLVPGDGPTVPVTAVAGVRYVETLWTGGKTLHDSWSEHIAVEQLPAEGPAIAIYRYVQLYPVGSRVEVVIPDGTGDALVFVIDIQQASPRTRPA